MEEMVELNLDNIVLLVNIKDSVLFADNGINSSVGDMLFQYLVEGSHFESTVTVANNYHILFFPSASTFAFTDGSYSGFFHVFDVDWFNTFSTEVNDRVGALNCNCIVIFTMLFLVIAEHGDWISTCRQ